MRGNKESKELEETNCEIRSIVNFDLRQYKELLDGPEYYEEDLHSSPTGDDSSKDTSSKLGGGFFGSNCKYSWLSRNNHLVVIDTRTGKCICSKSFQHKITSVSTFPTSSGQVPLLLIGLDNNALRVKDSVGYLSIFDCCTSNILTTVKVPAGVEKACVIHGGTEWEDFNDKRPDSLLPGNTGLIFAALRNLQHIVIDVNRPLWKNYFVEGKTLTSELKFVELEEFAPLSARKKNRKEFTHLAYNLMDSETEIYMGFSRAEFESTPLYDENLCSVLLSSEKTGCFITGCLGRVIIWQSNGSRSWISPLLDKNMYVTHVALIEPSDDPRPFYYLWVASQSDSSDSSAVLRMYAMLFSKKCSSKNGSTSLYYELASEPSLKFELELDEGEQIHTLQSIERESLRDTSDVTSRRGEDSLLLIGTSERSLIFDLNRWYKEQMPRTITECRNPNSVMASYRTRTDEVGKRNILGCLYVPRSLKETSINKGPNAMEELFYPNSLMIEWAEMGVDGIAWWLARGVQTELLREIMIAGPIVLVKPAETYKRCLDCGLIPYDSTSEDHPQQADTVHQREMLLLICLEQRWTSFLTNCGREWSDGSAAYLYSEFLKWGVQRATKLKLLADDMCVPLFDQSGANIGEAEARKLRFYEQQLECLTNVVGGLPNVRGDLEKQRRTLRRIATYLQVLVWFYDVGLLPETQKSDEDEDEDEISQNELSSKIPYPKNKLVEWYKKKRTTYSIEDADKQNHLFIDHLISHECLPIRMQWERECGAESPNPGSGYYPPPSLQSLLRIFLTDCHPEVPEVQKDEDDDNDDDDDDDGNDNPTDDDHLEMDSKHSVTIYLLMDLAMLLQGTYLSVDKLIKYPSAFKLNPSLIKLTQAFWLLDHDDFEGFFKIVTGQLTSGLDMKAWHHKLAINTLIRNDQHKMALMYLRVLKPPLSSLEDQGTLISLTVGQGLVETAFHSRPPSHYSQLLTRFFQACKANDKLKELLQLALDSEEEESFVRFLKETGNEDARLFYYLQRGRHMEARDTLGYSAVATKRNGQKSVIHPLSRRMLEEYNLSLPAITREFVSTLTKINTNSSKPQQTQGYPRPLSQCRDKTRNIYEVAYSKTREVCLKNEGSAFGYVPFLNAPVSTVICRAQVGNNQETLKGDQVVFAEKKLEGKRKLDAMSEGEDVECIGSDRKRQRLEGNSKLGGDGVAMRRLSMSQVCDTPLIQRRLPQDPCKSGGIAAETPHSILKIRQMLRNSNSPGFANRSGSSDKRTERETAKDARPARQIRFSIDRSQNLGESFQETMNVDDEEKDDVGSNASLSSKATEDGSCTSEVYYSPAVSAKSHRNSSILSENSCTMFFMHPKARPSYRRSSTTSYSPTSNLSQNESAISANLSVEASPTNNIEVVKKNKVKKNKNKSILSASYYNASILSPNTSFEESLHKLQVPMSTGLDHSREEESDDDDEDDQEIVASILSTGVDKSSSADSSVEEGEIREESLNTGDGSECDQVLQDEPMEIEFDAEKTETKVPPEMVESQEISEDEDIQEEIPQPCNVSVASVPFQETEISEDEETNEEKILPNAILSEEAHVQDNEISEDEDDQKGPGSLAAEDDNSFQSAGSHFSIPRFINLEDQDYSITRPLKMVLNNDLAKTQSFAKSILLDEHVMVDYHNDNELTEESDAEEDQKSPTEPADEYEITLNVSVSESTEVEKATDGLRKDGMQQESGLGKSATSSSIEKFTSEVAETKNSSKLVDEVSSKDDQSQRSSISSLSVRSDDVFEEVPRLRRSSRGRGSSSKESTPTKSDKSLETESKQSPSRTSSATKTDNPSLQRRKTLSQSKDDNKASKLTPSKVDIKPTVVELAPESPAPSETASESHSPLSNAHLSPVKESARQKPVTPKPIKRGRKARVASVTITEEKSDTLLPEESKQETTTENKPTKNKQTKTLDKSKVTELQVRTRATTRAKAKDSTIRETVTEAAEVTDDDGSSREQSVEKESSTKARSVRASSLATNTSTKRKMNSTRAESVPKDVEAKQPKQTGRRTRAASTASDKPDVDKKPVARRTRAASVNKDVSEGNKVVTRSSKRTLSTSTDSKAFDTSVRSTRQRGQSVPKDIPSALLDKIKSSSRSRRSTSLVKDTILEESISQLDSSSVSLQQSQTSHLQKEALLAFSSSPAANTRRRQSSIQSIPEELINEEVKKGVEDELTPRARRATSVDSGVIEKRLTRSKLTKTSIIKEVIPEEHAVTSSVVKKTRKKKNISNDVSNATRPKRGRKASESKDFEFSPPEETANPPVTPNECHTPTLFKFSEPTEQKFLTPVCDEDEDSSDVTTLGHNINFEKDCIARTTLQKPRTCFILPKRKKSKAIN